MTKIKCHESDTAAVYWCQGEGGEVRKPVCSNYGGDAEVGDGDGDGTGETGGAGETGGEDPEWNPPKVVIYDPTRDAYHIHEDFVAEIKLDWSLLTSDRTYVASTPAGHYQLFNVAPGDLADALGLQSGDVLRSVNGHELAGLDELLEAYAALEDQAEFELTIDRDGAMLQLTYLISAWCAAAQPRARSDRRRGASERAASMLRLLEVAVATASTLVRLPKIAPRAISAGLRLPKIAPRATSAGRRLPKIAPRAISAGLRLPKIAPRAISAGLRLQKIAPRAISASRRLQKIDPRAISRRPTTKSPIRRQLPSDATTRGPDRPRSPGLGASPPPRPGQFPPDPSLAAAAARAISVRSESPRRGHAAPPGRSDAPGDAAWPPASRSDLPRAALLGPRR